MPCRRSRDNTCGQNPQHSESFGYESHTPSGRGSYAVENYQLACLAMLPWCFFFSFSVLAAYSSCRSSMPVAMLDTGIRRVQFILSQTLFLRRPTMVIQPRLQSGTRCLTLPPSQTTVECSVFLTRVKYFLVACSRDLAVYRM